jgi:hypothetical protein
MAMLFCPACGRVGKIQDSMLGKEIRCPGCKHKFFASPPVRAARELELAEDDEDEGDETPDTDDDVIMEVQGIAGALQLLPNKIRIVRKGISAFLTHGLKGDKEIQISSISSIQFKPTDWLTNGYIQFSFMGGQEAQRGIYQAAQDENTVLFRTEHEAAFKKIKAAIEEAMQKPAGGRSGSAIEDLERLASLLEKGLITRDEFERKKRDLLR